MGEMLRQLERQLEALNDKDRAAVVEAIRSIVSGAKTLRGRIGLSKGAVVGVVGSVGVAMAQDKGLPEILAELRAKAAKAGKHVSALFQAL